MMAGCGDDEGSTAGDAAPPSGPAGFDTLYGNGHFGSWINDVFGLPAYRYEGCSSSECSEPEDVFHQIGNDNIVAVAHGDGYVELFTTSTFYRYANRVDEEARNYGGGFGWVRDGDETWSTLYEDRPESSSYERVFGMGYYRKAIEYNGLAVEQFIYPPAGGDEGLLERLVFTNLSDERKSIQYFDYWDVAWWLLKPIDPFVTESS